MDENLPNLPSCSASITGWVGNLVASLLFPLLVFVRPCNKVLPHPIYNIHIMYISFELNKEIIDGMLLIIATAITSSSTHLQS